MSFLTLITGIIFGSLAALTCICLLAERIALSIRTSSRTSSSYTHHDVYSDCEKGGFLASSEKEIESSTFIPSPAKNAMVVEHTYESDKLEMVGIAPKALMVHEHAVKEEVVATEEEACVALYSRLPLVKRASVQDPNEMRHEGSAQVIGMNNLGGDQDVVRSDAGGGVGAPAFSGPP